MSRTASAWLWGSREPYWAMTRVELLLVSLEPCAVIEAYKKDVDRTLIRENLKLTADQRVRKMISVLEFVEQVRRSTGVAH